MSDAAWTKIICRPEHRAVFEKGGFREDPYETPKDLPGAAAMIDEQANYGAWSELQAIAKKGGVPFFGQHGAGTEYGVGRYACDGSRFVTVECGHGGGDPVVEVGPDGIPDKDQLKQVAEYYEVLAAAKKAISEGTPRGMQWKSSDEILKGMDPHLLRDQRRWLFEVTTALRDGQLVDAGGVSWDGAVAAFDGLSNLLDDLADYAHDVLGMDCLLEEPE
jgi:hypothetical protein